MINKVKKYVCVCLAVVMLAGVLSGCGTDSGKIDTEKAELINKNEDLKRDNAQKAQEISDLNSLVESMKKTVAELEKEAEELGATIKELETSVETFKSEQGDKEAKLKELEDQIAAQNELIEELQNKNLIEFDPSVPYHTMYPHLYAKLADETVVPEGKTVYLTFDDGPSDRTDEILAILDKYNVKATFFVMPRKTDACYKRLRAIIDAGHTIGVHTYSHDYSVMYASVEAYLEDFNKAYEIVVDATGFKPDIFRFAGGSLNDRSYKIIAEMTRRGFTYYDWNASGDDSVSSPKPTTQSIIDNSLYWVRLKKEAVLLLHDEKSKIYTVQALPTIIETLLSEGYQFLPMNNQVTLYQQRKLNK